MKSDSGPSPVFNPKTPKIAAIAKRSPRHLVPELETIFQTNTNVYIDYANVRPWSNKLGWHIDLHRLKQFFDSFTTIQSVKFYVGTLKGDKDSEKIIKELGEYGYEVKTKLVKIIKVPIDVTSVKPESKALLENFIRRSVLYKFDTETIVYLNSKLKQLNDKGIYYIEDRKCNFDVELGRDMMFDYTQKSIETFILWSGDSDFADPIKQLLSDGKKVILFATSGKVSVELSKLVKNGLFIFDIKKIRNFICWAKEMQKGSPEGPLSSKVSDR